MNKAGNIHVQHFHERAFLFFLDIYIEMEWQAMC